MLTQTLDQQYLAHTYNRFPLEIVGGKGRSSAARTGGSTSTSAAASA
ncbi:MAG: hypothetical protein ACLR8M_10840 [Oscillospiraceae bacterium]